MKIFKKAVSLTMALLMSAGISACGADTKWVAQYGETTVPAGIYLWAMMSAYYDATAEMDAEVKEPLKQQVDGQTVSDKIVIDAKEELNTFIAVEEKFTQMGLSLEEVVESTIAQNVDSYWQYIGPTYEENGISKETYTRIYLNDAKKSAIFNALYGAGGEQEVPESELKEKFYADYAKIIIIPLMINLSDADEESNLKTARERIAKYEQQLKDGKSMEDVYYEAKKEVTGDETLEKPEPGSSYSLVSRDGGQYDQVVIDAIFGAAIGEPVTVETEHSLYLFVRYDIKENENDFISRRDAVLSALKSVEFSELTAEWGKALTDVTYNDKALSRYTPQKLKL